VRRNPVSDGGFPVAERKPTAEPALLIASALLSKPVVPMSAITPALLVRNACSSRSPTSRLEPVT